VVFKVDIAAIDIDPNGNIYVTGDFSGTNVSFQGVTTSIDDQKTAIGASRDFFIAKYNSNGELIWLVVSSSTVNVRSRAISVNSTGVYVTGWYREGNLNVVDQSSNTIVLANGGDLRDSYVYALDLNGNNKWIKGIVGSNNLSERGWAICSNEQHVFVAGETESNTLFIDPINGNQNFTTFTTGAVTIFVAGYNTGNGGLNWATGIGNANDQTVRAIATYGSNVFIAGGINDDLGVVNFPGSTTISIVGTNQEFFSASIDTTTVTTNWVSVEENNSTQDAFAESLDIDETGYLVVGGSMTGDTDFGNGSLTLSSGGGADAVVVFNELSTGNLVLALASNGPSKNNVKALSFRGPGLYICGDHDNSATFGPFSLPNGAGSDGYTSKMDIVCTTPPEIICVPSLTVNADPTCIYSVPDYSTIVSASANCGSALEYTQTPAIGSSIGLGDTTVWVVVEDNYGNQDSCSFLLTVIASVNPKPVSCGAVFLNETTSGAGNNGANFSCVNTNTPGEDQYYEIDVPAGISAIKVTLENVSSTTDTIVDLFWIGSGCPGSTCLEATQYDINAGAFLNGTNFDVYEAIGPGKFYLVVDARIAGIDAYDITFDCIQSGVGFDESCAGDNDNDGVISTVNGSSVLTMEPCENVTVCQELILENTGPEWVDSVIYDLGECYTNINSVSPSGSGSGFYNTSGAWQPVVDVPSNKITWDFTNAINPLLGDGNISAYTCQSYNAFCFNADIASTCQDSSGLNITVTLYDDGILSPFATAVSLDILLNNTFKLDNDPPVINNCPANITISPTNGNCSAVATWVAPTATDECPSPTVLQTAGMPSGSSFPVGVTTIEYTATDPSGVSSQCSFTITVEDQEAPSVTCVVSQTDYLDGSCSFVIPSYASILNATDNCVSSAMLSYVQTPATGTIVSASTPITIVTSDTSNNSTSCTFNLILLDTISPSITCPITQTLNVNSNCQAVLPDYTVMASSTDNCSSVVLSQSPAPGTLVNIGSQTITLTSTDTSSNSQTCQFTVNVVDNTVPIIVCPPAPPPVYVNNSCQYTLSNYTGSLILSDNCPGVTVTQSPIAGTIIGLGVTNIQLTATDAAGNISTCAFNITALDSTNPVFTSCPTNITSCDAVVTWAMPTATDNCGIVNILSTSPWVSGSTFPVGTNTVTYEANDGHGNTSVCSFQVTILPQVDPSFVLPDTICLPLTSFDLTASTTIGFGEVDTFYSTNQAVINNGILDPMATGIGSYEITHVVYNSTCADSITQTVDIIQAFNPQFTSPDTICASIGTIDLNTYLAPGNNNGTWSGVGIMDSTWTLTGVSGLTPVLYILGIGSCLDTATNLIEVLPNVDPFWNGDDTICNSSPPIDLNTRISGTSGGVFVGPGVDSNTGIFDASTANLGFNVITYSVGISPCEETHIDSIFIIAEPSIEAGLDDVVCGDSILLNAQFSSIGGSWLPQANLTFTDPTSEVSVVKTNTEGIYTLTWEIDNGYCPVIDDVELTFYFEPSIINAGPDQDLNYQESTVLDATAPDYGVGMWSSINDLVFEDTLGINTVVSGLMADGNYAIWTVTNGICPPVSDTVEITISGLWIPTGFSPNGDGDNEFFKIKGLEYLNTSDLQVFNRWGNLVYKSSPYKNNWNGLNLSGQPLPSDTYFYIIKADQFENSGYIIIKRE